MKSELDPIIATFNAIVFIITSPWEALEPFITRILHIIIIVFAVMWTYKKIKKI
jgi:hypothetical protein